MRIRRAKSGVCRKVNDRPEGGAGSERERAKSGDTGASDSGRNQGSVKRTEGERGSLKVERRAGESI
jgi:hypothetical protein